MVDHERRDPGSRGVAVGLRLFGISATVGSRSIDGVFNALTHKLVRRAITHEGSEALMVAIARIG